MNTITIEYLKLLHMSALAQALVDTLGKIPVCPHYERDAEIAAGLADLLADLLEAAKKEQITY